MGSKRIPIRLYRQHDMDLIVLYLNKDFGFNKALRRALHCYGKEPFLFMSPNLEEFGKEREIKYAYRMELKLNEEKDADIIELLNRVKPLYRNAFIKSVMRGSMIGPYAYGCMIDSDENTNAKNIIEETIEAAMEGVIADPPDKSKKINKKKKPGNQKQVTAISKKQKIKEKPKKNEKDYIEIFEEKELVEIQPEVDATESASDDNNFFFELSGMLNERIA